MPEGKPFDIYYYINIILRRKWMIAISFFVISTLAVTASFLMPRIYKATCSILVQRAEVKNPLISDENVRFDIDQRLKHIYQLMASRNNLMRVIKRLDLDAGIEDQEEVEKMIIKMQKVLEVKPRSDNFFEISY
ncbi:MAG: hypothetical protein HY999_03325, partial [Nitrospinae bacterium]|nr:hypothetical protein [Nitrospinota bacterium]